MLIQIRKLINPSTPTEVKWITTQMAEKLGRETHILTTSREMFFYLIYFLNLLFVCYGMMSPIMHIFMKAMSDQFTQTRFQSTYHNITFKGIRSAVDFWKYTETIFIRSVYWDHWYDDVQAIKETKKSDKNILYENVLMAVPGIRQVKVRNDSCKIHPEFRRMFLVCYDKYSERAADKKPFGPAKGTAWTYNKPKDVKSYTHYGKIDTYDGGGFYQKLGQSANETRSILATLKDNLWITRGTRSIFIDFTVYNANVNLFSVVQLVFEFPRCGGVVPTAYFFTVKLLRYGSFTDHIILACELIHLCFIIYYSAEEYREILYFKWKYLLQLWNYIDQFIILMTYSYVILAIVKYFQVLAIIRDASKDPNQYITFRAIAFMEITSRNALAITLFASSIKIFKYLNFNHTMIHLSKAFSKCGKELSGFSVMFFMIFASFAEIGYLVFGTQVKQFSTFWISVYNLFLSTIQEFDYHSMERSYCVFAPIYALLFIGLVFIVLLNLFLAIIYDTYIDAKVELARERKLAQMTDLWKRASQNFMYKLGCAKCLNRTPEQFTPNAIIIEALQSSGFYESDINQFFMQHNIDPEVIMGDDDVLKLKEDLMKYISDKTKKEPHQIVDDSRLVAMGPFNEQQRKLVRLDAKMTEIVDRLDTILDKLNTMEYFKKN